jgi:predicted AlkP superfamily phosphohydrolase/phosphomutase
MSDGAGHTWMGVLDPQSPRYDRSVADKLWPFYTQVFQLQDEWLGAVLDAAGSQAVVCLVSDHGMAGVGKGFNPNTVLEKAGLLVRTADNKIDLARTKACFPPWSDYALVVNGTDWKGGIVASSSGGEREGVLQQAREALLAAVDPETGQHVVTGVFRPDDIAHLGIGGPSGGDLYLELAPGYSPSSQTGESIVSKDDSPIGSGVHGFLPLRKTMQAICFMGGAGVARGRQVPGIRQIDVAPTLSRLLGIPAPRDAQGHVVGEILRQ